MLIFGVLVMFWGGFRLVIGSVWILEWYCCRGVNDIGIGVFKGVECIIWWGWLLIGVVWYIFLVGKVIFGVYVVMSFFFFCW